MELERYRANGKAKPKQSKRPPRHRAGSWFIKGPIPFDWITSAAELPGKTLATGLALWFEAGRTKTRCVKVTPRLLAMFAIERHTGRRALQRLADASLVSLICKKGRCPVVTILNTETDRTDSPRTIAKSDK